MTSTAGPSEGGTEVTIRMEGEESWREGTSLVVIFCTRLRRIPVKAKVKTAAPIPTLEFTLHYSPFVRAFTAAHNPKPSLASRIPRPRLSTIAGAPPASVSKHASPTHPGKPQPQPGNCEHRLMASLSQLGGRWHGEPPVDKTSPTALCTCTAPSWGGVEAVMIKLLVNKVEAGVSAFGFFKVPVVTSVFPRQCKASLVTAVTLRGDNIPESGTCVVSEHQRPPLKGPFLDTCPHLKKAA